MGIRLKKYVNRANVKDLCFLVALGIIGFVFLVIGLSALVLIAGLTVTWFIPVAAALITLSGLTFAFFRFFKRLPVIYFPILLLVLALAVAVSFSAAGSFDDASWDGQDYHQSAILNLAGGWNPYYGYLAAPADYNPNSYGSFTHIWVNHYPKGSWMFAQNIMVLTGDIELGKAINPLFIAASFFLCLSALLAVKRLRSVFAVLFSLLAAFSPVVMYQFLSFYVDGLIGSLILCLFSAAFLILLKRGRFLHWLMFALLVVIIVNLKFSGIVFAFVIAAGLFVGVIIRERKFRQALIAFIFCASAFVVGIVGVGFHPYVTNWAAKGHPLYPLFGDKAIDILSMQYPKNYRFMGNPERFFDSLFAKSGGGYDNNGGGFSSSVAKTPFTVARDEITIMNIDPRVGGFGPLMGGIIILSLLLFAVNTVLALKNKRLKDLFWSCLLLFWLLVSVFIIPEAWWARYIPHFWLFPIFIMVFSFNRRNTIVEKIIAAVPRYALILYMAINSYLVADNYIGYNEGVNARLETQLYTIRNQATPPDVQFGYFKESWRHKLQAAGINYFAVGDIYARDYRSRIYFDLSFGQVRCGIK